MIKFVFKKSLIYLSVYKSIYYLRTVEVVLMKYKFSFNSPIILIFLMGLGEMIGGLSVYLFINKAFKKKKIKQYLGIQLIKHEFVKVKLDGWTKIIFLIFFEGFFDFTEAVILFPSIGSDKSISSTINHRFSIITTIASSLLCTYLLKFKMLKHQKFILVAISIVFILLLIIEILFNTEYKTFLIIFILNILSSLFITFMDIIERYLGDNDFPNPFGILAGEGSVVIILTIFYSIGRNPFGQLKQFYEELDTSNFILLVFMLFLYLFLTICLNVYKIHCNVFLSPVARTLTDYLFNPIYLIFSFFFENDFMYKGKQNLLFFLLNEFMSFVIIFLGFVYNEYIVLFCCGLESDTLCYLDMKKKLISESVDDIMDCDNSDDDSDEDNKDDENK